MSHVKVDGVSLLLNKRQPADDCELPTRVRRNPLVYLRG